MNDYQMTYDNSRSPAFHERSNEREVNLSCLRQKVPAALQRLQLGQGKQALKVLSIGAGDGYMDHELFNIVREEYLNGEKLEDVKIEITAIEPNQGLEAEYKRHFETPISQGAVSVEFKAEKFQSYMKSKEHARNQYDLIQAIHSLYFDSQSLEPTLKHCYDHELGDKGLIVCLVAGEDCIYNMVREGLNIKRHDGKERMPLKIAERIRNLAMENEWDISPFPCPITIDVTGIVKELTEKGKVLFYFMTKERNFFDRAHQESKDAVLEKLKEISTEEDGRMIVEEANELLVIYKNPQE